MTITKTRPAAIRYTETNEQSPLGATSPLAITPTKPMNASRAGVELEDWPCGGHGTSEIHLATAAAGPILYDTDLYLLAAQLHAIENLRLATANRHRMATRDTTDSDGHVRGLGLTADHPSVRVSAVLLDELEKAEHKVVLGLNRLMRAHPLGAWQKVTRGVGEKTLARLLACIGDPYWNTLHDRPRTVSELWAYCGLHTVPAALPSASVKSHTNDEPRMAARRTRGQRANWSTDAKMRVYLIAETSLKAGGYREVYDDHKARAAAATHIADCPPCKAKAGSPLKPGHQHARAMRAMSKAILKDLWCEARRIHQEAAQ